MSELYNRIEKLCTIKNVNITTMCKQAGVSRASLTDLKMGRKQSLSTDTLAKIAAYFDVSIDYLLGNSKEKAPTGEGERAVSDDDIMFALWGDTTDVDKGDLEDVKRYAAFVRERKKKK